MTYSREQMIEAYKQGFIKSYGPTNNPEISASGLYFAEDYVDSLKNQSEQVKNTARIDDPPETRQRYDQWQVTALAKILGGFIFRASTMHLINERTGMALHQDFLEDAIRQLREAFPELDTES